MVARLSRTYPSRSPPLSLAPSPPPSSQFIASAPSLFPAEYVTEFQKCLDRTPPVPFSVIKRILRDELRRPVEEVYEWIDPEPLASASIAQVRFAP